MWIYRTTKVVQHCSVQS